MTSFWVVAGAEDLHRSVLLAVMLWLSLVVAAAPVVFPTRMAISNFSVRLNT
ncbi:MAG: hypothetical protein WBB44_06275 [Candidatus Nanopelagicales bacterium]